MEVVWCGGRGRWVGGFIIRGGGDSSRGVITILLQILLAESRLVDIFSHSI